MATYTLSNPKIKPKQLGLNNFATQQQAITYPKGTMWYVVSKGFALTMQGYKANKSKTGNGTLYGVFNNQKAAKALQRKCSIATANGVVSYASIVVM